eukprot:14766246-Ditylum_brightwellii.AAC.1
MGIATAFKLQCDSHLNYCHMIEPKRSCFYGIKKEGSRSTHERLTWYNLNNQLVLSQLQNGAETAEAATTLVLLDLLCALSFGNKEEAMGGSLLEEIKLTPHPRKKNHLYRVSLSPREMWE